MNAPSNPAFLFLSPQDPSFSLLLHDKLQVPNSSRRAWNERDSRCDVCATHLTQLKQEAVHMVLTLDQWDLSPTSSPTALSGRYGFQGPPGPTAACAAGWPPPLLPYSSSPSSSSAAAGPHAPRAASRSPSPSPSQTPTPSPSHGPSNNSHWSPPGGQSSSPNSQTQSPGHRQGSKPSSLGLGGGADRRNVAPSNGKAGPQQQPVTGTSSPSNNVSGTTGAPLQAHQNLNRSNGGVTLYPYQVRATNTHSHYQSQALCVCVCVSHKSASLFEWQKNERFQNVPTKISKYHSNQTSLE